MNFDDAFSHFDTIHACDRRTDRQTDIRTELAWHIRHTRYSIYADAHKNQWSRMLFTLTQSSTASYQILCSSSCWVSCRIPSTWSTSCAISDSTLDLHTCITSAIDRSTSAVMATFLIAIASKTFRITAINISSIICTDYTASKKCSHFVFARHTSNNCRNFGRQMLWKSARNRRTIHHRRWFMYLQYVVKSWSNCRFYKSHRTVYLSMALSQLEDYR